MRIRSQSLADADRARIVAVVGADGTGKTTQVRRLSERLRAEGVRARSVRPVFLLFDPYRLSEGGGNSTAFPGSPRMSRLRQDGTRGGRRPRSPLLLTAVVGYAYALASYLALRWARRRSEVVVCDRYFYQFFYDLVGPAGSKLARSFPRPDLVVWLDARLETIVARSGPSPPDRPEVEYLSSVIEYYREIGERLDFRRIDAEMDETLVAEAIWDAVKEGLTSCDT